MIDERYTDVDENDFIDDYEDDHIQLDDPEDMDIALDDTSFENDLDGDIEDDDVSLTKGNLLQVLNNELKLKEYQRGYITFKVIGNKEIYQGVPMIKINDTKFVFKVINDGDKLKQFKLSDIVLVD